MSDLTHDGSLVERYLAMWNEPDPARRRTLLRGTWAPDGAQILCDPPSAARTEAAELRFARPSFEVHGYDALEARVAKAYEMFIEPGAFRFQARGPAHDLLPGVTSVAWEMVSVTDGTRAGGGVDVLDLDEDGRIRRDYQFIQR